MLGSDPDTEYNDNERFFLIGIVEHCAAVRSALALFVCRWNQQLAGEAFWD